MSSLKTSRPHAAHRADMPLVGGAERPLRLRPRPISDKPETQEKPFEAPARARPDLARSVGAFLRPDAGAERMLRAPTFGAALSMALEQLENAENAQGGGAAAMAGRGVNAYAASVIRAHLEARRQLAQLANALIKT